MLHRRSSFALLLALGVLSACSGTGSPQSGLLPQTAERTTSAIGGGGGPSLGPMTPIAAVDLSTGAPFSKFVLTDPKRCFGPAKHQGDDNDDQGDDNGNNGQSRQSDDHGRGNHYGWSSSSNYGTPYTPATNVLLNLGPFSLVNPCGASASHGNRGDDAALRHTRNIVPVPTGSGAHIIALDSTDATHTPIDIDGPASDDGTTYTFAQLRFARALRAGHTYTFALAVPATPSPSPAPTPTPEKDD